MNATEPELEIKGAIQVAKRFIAETFAINADDMLVEELHSGTSAWRITISFPKRRATLGEQIKRTPYRSHGPGGHTQGYYADLELRRVEVSKETGDVIDVEIRTLD